MAHNLKAILSELCKIIVNDDLPATYDQTTLEGIAGYHTLQDLTMLALEALDDNTKDPKTEMLKQFADRGNWIEGKYVGFNGKSVYEWWDGNPIELAQKALGENEDV